MNCAWSSRVGFYHFMWYVYIPFLESKEATSVYETGPFSLGKYQTVTQFWLVNSVHAHKVHHHLYSQTAR